MSDILGKQIAKGSFRIQIIAEWEGLTGLSLRRHRGSRYIFDDHVAYDDTYVIEGEVGPNEVEAALPATFAKIATPLLRRFSFLNLPTNFMRRSWPRCWAEISHNIYENEHASSGMYS